MSEGDRRAARPSYFLTRLVLLRLLGGIYFIAFLGLAEQLRPLIGRDGLLPAPTFLTQVAAAAGSRAANASAMRGASRWPRATDSAPPPAQRSVPGPAASAGCCCGRPGRWRWWP